MIAKKSLISKSIQVQGFNIRYVDNGKTGLPVIFIHGLGGSSDSWSNNISELSRLNLRTVALDLPGFGYSDKHKIKYSIQFYSDFVIKFLYAIGIKGKISLIGSSLGGQIGAEIAIRYKDKVSKLVLVSPAGVPPRSFTGTTSLRKYIKILQASSPKEIKKGLMSLDNRPVANSYAKSVFNIISTPGAKAAFMSALEESARSPRFLRKIANIETKLLVIWGKKDNIIPVKFSEPFLEMPNCRLVIIENCGHRPHIENPNLFNLISYNFICE